MLTTSERDGHFASVKYQLYRKHGLELFNNWLLMRRDKLERSEVVESLTYPGVRELAKHDIDDMLNKIEELKILLVESSDMQVKHEQTRDRGRTGKDT